MRARRAFPGAVGLSVVLFCGRWNLPAATIVVNDAGDALHSPGCATSGAGTCTLRDAITFANANPGADAIHFLIPGAGVHTIGPLAALPVITDNAGVTIDGYTQPGASPNTLARGNDATLLIEVDGSAIPSGPFGMILLNSDNNVVRGLVIGGYLIDSGIGIWGSQNTIEGNYIGTDATGMAAAPSRAGITIIEGAGNRIGGPDPASRNVVVGSSLNVLHIQASGSQTVQGNYIGTNREGTASLGSMFHGISIDGSAGHLIGGFGVGEGNLISGNGAATGEGIVVFSPGNTIAGNLIGTDRDGLQPVPNGGAGISIGTVPGNVVARNTIAFNTGPGIVVSGGARITENRIFSNGQLGIETGSTDGIPALVSAASNGVRTSVEGTLSSVPNAPIRLEFFASPECDPSGFGEGRTFLGAVTVTTDGGGTAPIQAVVPASGAGVLTATATDPDGNTTQFSACVPIEFTVRAQAPAFSPEFQVNTYTTGQQGEPVVGMDPFGNFVIVWDSLGQLGAGFDVFGQRYDSIGAPVGGELQVNTTTSGNQAHPSVGVDFFGTFVVVWGDEDVSGRRFDAGGNPQGDEFPISTDTNLTHLYPDIARNADGDFVVVWEASDGSGLDVLGRRFDTFGAPQGDPFPVNTEPPAIDFPSAAIDDDGDFVVVWSSLDEDGSLHGVAGQRFDSAGAPQGGEFQVNSYTTGTQAEGSVGMDSAGNFAVSWRSEGDGSETGVFGRRFDAAGQTLGEGFPVNSTTTESQLRPRLAMDSAGNFVVAWTSQGQDGQGYGVFGQQFDPSGKRIGPEFPLNSYTAGGQARQAVAMSDSGSFVVAWTDYTQDGSNTGIFARRGDARAPQPMRVDADGTGETSNLNGVLEPGETAIVAPAWRNALFAPLNLQGTASNLTGPPGPAYVLGDASADYGTILPGQTEDCFSATLDCYALTVTGTRPAAHWDATFEETVTMNATKTWTLHVGGSFADTPPSHLFYAYVENVFHNGVTSGCGSGNYCPGNPVRRDQMAVFLLKGEHGPSYSPPACTGVFSDVPCPSPFADWIEQLAEEGITAGCGPSAYCPDMAVTRQQMAAFLLKAEHGASYVPPDCAGVFDDVPCSSLFAPFIEQLAAEAVTGGCSASPPLYCPASSTNRGQMAVFLVRTFGLLLYGP